MYPFILNLEVQNSFDHPNQAQLLAEELGDMSARIEDTTEFSEEDVFLAQAFESGVEALEENLPLYAKWIADLSRDFPDLIFSADITEPAELGSSEGVLERWYIRDGRRQIVEPYLVVPDFDPDEAGEEVQ
jgi:hypothetical protein